MSKRSTKLYVCDTQIKDPTILNAFSFKKYAMAWFHKNPKWNLKKLHRIHCNLLNMLLVHFRLIHGGISSIYCVRSKKRIPKNTPSWSWNLQQLTLFVIIVINGIVTYFVRYNTRFQSPLPLPSQFPITISKSALCK